MDETWTRIAAIVGFGFFMLWLLLKPKKLYRGWPIADPPGVDPPLHAATKKPTTAELRKSLLQAIRNDLDVDLDYSDNDGNVTSRRVTPQWLGGTKAARESGDEHGSRNNLFCGYCHLRKEPRHFRLDRIITMEVLGLADEERLKQGTGK